MMVSQGVGIKSFIFYSLDPWLFLNWVGRTVKLDTKVTKTNTEIVKLQTLTDVKDYNH